MEAKNNKITLVIMSIILLILAFSPKNAFSQIPAMINYQGYLTDNTGQPMAGSVNMVFSIFSAQSGGSKLWTEAKVVSVDAGLYSVILGESTPINLSFDGPYYLEVQVGAEVLSPRQPLTSVAYAFRSSNADDADLLDGLDANDFSQTSHIHNDLYYTETELQTSGSSSIHWDNISSKPAGFADGVDSGIATVNAGNGLTGGGSSDPVTLDVGAGTGITVNTDNVALNTTYTDGRYVEEAQADSISTVMIQDGAIGSAQIANGAVDNADLANNAVTAAKINPNIVSSIDGVSNDGGNIDLIAGTNITILSNDTADTITISASAGGSGDITSVIAGSGLTEGGTTGDVTLNVGAGTGITVNANDVAFNTTYGDGRYVNEGQSNSITSGMVAFNYAGSSTEGGAASSVAVPLSLSGSDSTAIISGVNSNSTSTSAGVSGYGEYGVVGNAKDSSGAGVYGTSFESFGYNYGMLGTAGEGVYGYSPGEYGVYGNSSSGYGGYFTSGNDHNDLQLGGSIGRINTDQSSSSSEMILSANGNVTIRLDNDGGGSNFFYVRNSGGTAVCTVDESGNLTVPGSVNKSGGSFKIDHPLDPENKYLYHSFVESPDMKNVYDGVVELDEIGEAWIEFPDWFEALNRDFRYQLTPIGAPGPNLFVAEEVSGNRFKIAGGDPGMKVSWQVTGIRQDPYAKAHPISVEEDKPPEERGYYLHPDLYGQPEEMRIEAGNKHGNIQSINEAEKNLSKPLS
jgi:hypothetical protein